MPRNLLVVLSDADSNLWAPLLEQTSLAKAGLARLPEGARIADLDTAERRQRPHAKLSDDQVDEMIALYRDGATVYELANQFGCHRQTVSRWLRSRGVHMRLTGMTPEQVEEAQLLYESGMTLKAVGQAIGVSRNHIRDHLVDAGVRLRNRTSSKDSTGRRHWPCHRPAYSRYFAYTL